MSEANREAREPIRGRVARVLNTREVALNIGANDGVRVGMKFDVMDPLGEDIRDPQTNEPLGSLERAKIRLEIAEVKDRLSVARTRSYNVNVGGTGGFIGRDLEALSRMMLPSNWVRQYETLRHTDEKGHELDEDESLVKQGDPVVEVLEEEKKKPVQSGAQYKVDKSK